MKSDLIRAQVIQKTGIRLNSGEKVWLTMLRERESLSGK